VVAGDQARPPLGELLDAGDGVGPVPDQIAQAQDGVGAADGEMVEDDGQSLEIPVDVRQDRVPDRLSPAEPVERVTWRTGGPTARTAPRLNRPALRIDRDR
jgi:hypothetical protein